MGKYSIDAFEQYPLVKIRPSMLPQPESCYQLLRISWKDMENGTLGFPDLPDTHDGTVILQMDLNAPDFLTGDVQAASAFIRRIGANYGYGAGFGGIVADCGSFEGAALRELACAYIQAFDQGTLLAAPGSRMMEALRKEESQPGLWLELSRGVLSLRKAIAVCGLERTWHNRPVYVYQTKPLNAAELDAAIRWHASGANINTCLGPYMTLRRMMFPKELTAGGTMPLRMWWQNLGSAPLYGAAEVQIRLEAKTGELLPIRMDGLLPRCSLGDTMLNADARLPDLAEGVYAIWCGLRSGGKMLKLGLPGQCRDGMYRIGTLHMDRVARPYLKTIWKEQYADGYYPLEDPAQPD